MAFPYQANHSQIICYWSICYKTVPNIAVDLSATPRLALYEVEQVQRQRIAGLIGHIFQLTYVNMVEELVQEEKPNRCHGCAIQQPSQRQHSCLMMGKEDSWFYYRGDVVKKLI